MLSCGSASHTEKEINSTPVSNKVANIPFKGAPQLFPLVELTPIKSLLSSQILKAFVHLFISEARVKNSVCRHVSVPKYL